MQKWKLKKGLDRNALGKLRKISTPWEKLNATEAKSTCNINDKYGADEKDKQKIIWMKSPIRLHFWNMKLNSRFFVYELHTIQFGIDTKR